MKRIALFVIMALLVVGFAAAEMSLDIKVASDDVDVTIDGLNFHDTVNEIWSHSDDWSSGMSSWDIAKISNDVSFILLGKTKRYPFSDAEYSIAQSLDNAFISTNEGEYLMNIIKQLNVRIEALEKTLQEIAGDEYCRQKINVTLKYDLKAVSCEDTTFYNAKINGLGKLGFAYVGIKTNGNNNSSENQTNESQQTT